MRVRFLSLMLCAAAIFTFSSCIKSETESNHVTLYKGSWLEPIYTRVDTGIIYHDNDTGTSFFDYETLLNLSICSRPNCTHDSSDENCTAQGLSTEIAYYNDKLYYLDNNSYINDDLEMINETSIYSCDRDGSNRNKLKTIIGVQPAPFQSLYMLKDGRIYYIFSEPEYVLNESTKTQEYLGVKAMHLYSFDIANNKYIKLSTMVEGFEVSVSVAGFYENYIYFISSKAKERTYGEGMNTDEIMENTQYEYKKLNIETGAVENWDNLPSSDAIFAFMDGYIYFQDGIDGEKSFFVKRIDMKSGKEEALIEMPVSSAYLVDSKLFVSVSEEFGNRGFPIFSASNKRYYYDLETEELHELNFGLNNVLLNIVDTYEDNYILNIREMDDENNAASTYMAKTKKSDFLSGQLNLIAENHNLALY